MLNKKSPCQFLPCRTPSQPRNRSRVCAMPRKYRVLLRYQWWQSSRWLPLPDIVNGGELPNCAWSVWTKWLTFCRRHCQKHFFERKCLNHHNDVIMGAIASQITSLTIVHSSACSKKTSKLRATGLCVGNSPGTGEFPAQMASNAENLSF